MNRTERVTHYLQEISQGREEAWEPLWQALYQELKKLAAVHMRKESPGHTLQPTALVNEAYLRLVDQKQASWENRAHFLGAASNAMRRVLVDLARQKSADKRGGARRRVTLTEEITPAEELEIDVLALHEALGRLAELDEQTSRIVELKYFGGLTVEEISHLLACSPRTVKRDLRLARAWLRSQLAEA